MILVSVSSTAALFCLLIYFIIASKIVIVIPLLPLQTSRDVTRCNNVSHCEIRYSFVVKLTLKSWKKR